MHDNEFRTLLNHLECSWGGYRKVRKGVKKRIRKHMHQVGCPDVASYLELLRTEPDVGKACDRLMTVSISRFYRDPTLWEVLEEVILPELIRSEKKSVCVWSAGCACGEEAYSLKIVWDRLDRTLSALPTLEIIATDMNSVCLEKGRSGIYPISSLKELNQEDLPVYFKRDAGRNRYEVISSLKEGVTWKAHHLFRDPPGSEFQAIFMRNNILTYYLDPLKKEAFSKVIGALAPSGFLIIGSREQLPNGMAGLKAIPQLSYVFRKTVLKPATPASG